MTSKAKLAVCRKGPDSGVSSGASGRTGGLRRRVGRSATSWLRRLLAGPSRTRTASFVSLSASTSSGFDKDQMKCRNKAARMVLCAQRKPNKRNVPRWLKLKDIRLLFRPYLGT